ncbi:hypothetical protein [Burkholderia sp. Bp9031]|uniref:hypothetical protein n=1 Tax=Burkholderia sp. Bp9031 TaxID=2184566 RepID=UPI000A932E51|nr:MULTISPECIES: hypothetical protein [Burkholderia]
MESIKNERLSRREDNAPPNKPEFAASAGAVAHRTTPLLNVKLATLNHGTAYVWLAGRFERIRVTPAA